jgi:hypothetical protein
MQILLWGPTQYLYIPDAPHHIHHRASQAPVSSTSSSPSLTSPHPAPRRRHNHLETFSLVLSFYYVNQQRYGDTFPRLLPVFPSYYVPLPLNSQMLELPSLN